MSKTNKFSPEVRERAVRMVQEHRGEYPSLTLSQVFAPFSNRADRHDWALTRGQEHVVKRSKFTEEQIAFALKQQELGASVDEVCRKCQCRPRFPHFGRSKFPHPVFLGAQPGREAVGSFLGRPGPRLGSGRA